MNFLSNRHLRWQILKCSSLSHNTSQKWRSIGYLLDLFLTIKSDSVFISFHFISILFLMNSKRSFNIMVVRWIDWVLNLSWVVWSYRAREVWSSRETVMSLICCFAYLFLYTRTYSITRLVSVCFLLHHHRISFFLLTSFKIVIIIIKICKCCASRYFALLRSFVYLKRNIGSCLPGRKKRMYVTIDFYELI